MDKIIGFINGRFLINEDERYILHKGNCAVKNGVILDFDIDNQNFDKIIDMNGALIIPAFQNAHLHLGETLFKNLEGNWNLETYLNFTEWWNQQLGSAREDAWINSANITLKMAIQSGTGTICCARGNELMSKYGLRGLSGYPIMESKKLSHYIEKGLEGYLEFSNNLSNSKIKPGIFLHSLYVNGEDSLKLAKQCYNANSHFITVHVDETLESSVKTRDRWGEDSIDILNNYELLRNNTILVHGGLLKDKDFKLIAEKKSGIVLCPESNKTLNTKCCNPHTLKEYGVNWCIGSDGIATGKTANLLYQAKTAGLMFPNFTKEELLSAITIRPAEIMGLGDKSGLLKKGYFADFAIFNNSEGDDVVSILNWLFSDIHHGEVSLFVEGKQLKIDLTETNNEYYPNAPLTMEIAKQMMGVNMYDETDLHNS